MIRVYRYVVHGEVDDYLAAGWIYRSSLGPWSCLMLACCCNPDGDAPRACQSGGTGL